MGIYGGSNKNLFPLPSNASNRPAVAAELAKNKYNLQVNDTTQIAQVYRQGNLVAGGALGQTGDVSIGTYNLKTKTFTPDPTRQALATANPNSDASEELKFFGSADGKKLITEKSATTVQKGVIDNGGTTQQAQNAALKVTGSNAATTTEAGAPTAAEKAAVAAEEASAKKNSRTKYDDRLVYPEKLQSEYQDCIRFSALEYKPPGLSSQGQGATAGLRAVSLSALEKNKRAILGTVILPIPSGIGDGNSVGWSDDSIDDLTRAFANIAKDTITGGANVGATTAGNEVNGAMAGGGSDAKSMTAAVMTQYATGTNNLQQRISGNIGNPNLELLFTGTNLRSFTFTFRLSPRSEDEAIIVRKIIRFFKQTMSVKRSESTLLLRSPHTFAISYLTKNKEHPYLNKFKECALQYCNVSYTPDGNYMSFDGPEPAMTSYELSLTFRELEAIFDDDYKALDSNADTQIGY